MCCCCEACEHWVGINLVRCALRVVGCKINDLLFSASNFLVLRCTCTVLTTETHVNQWFQKVRTFAFWMCACSYETLRVCVDACELHGWSLNFGFRVCCLLLGARYLLSLHVCRKCWSRLCNNIYSVFSIFVFRHLVDDWLLWIRTVFYEMTCAYNGQVTVIYANGVSEHWVTWKPSLSHESNKK